MGTFNQIGAGLLAGFVISFVVAYVAFQAELFRQGAESIGVSFLGFSYFFGSLLTSFIFWGLSKGKTPARYLGFFFVAVVAVGSIGLNNLMADPNIGSQLDLQRNFEAMAMWVARIFFWGVPAALVILYGFALVEAHSNKSQ